MESIEPLTEDELNLLARRKAGPFATVYNYSVQHLDQFEISRFGMTNVHFIVTCYVKFEVRSPGVIKRPPQRCTFFIKAPPLSPMMRNLVQDEETFTDERRFHRDVVFMMRGAKFDAWKAESILTEKHFIAFENISAYGFQVMDNDIYDLEHMKSLLTALAHMHASSIYAEMNHKRPINTLYKNAFYEKVFTNEGRCAAITKLEFETLRLLAEKFEFNGDFMSNIFELISELVKPVQGKLNVINHGNLWNNNIMFHEIKNVLKCRLVNFQMLRYTTPAVDLSMAIYLHTQDKFRDTYEQEMLEHYHTELKKLLDHCGHSEKLPLFDDLVDMYKKRRIIGLAYRCLIWPAAVKSYLTNPDALQKWYLVERFSFYEIIISQDSSFRHRIREFVLDLLQEASKFIRVEDLVPSNRLIVPTITVDIGASSDEDIKLSDEAKSSGSTDEAFVRSAESTSRSLESTEGTSTRSSESIPRSGSIPRSSGSVGEPMRPRRFTNEAEAIIRSSESADRQSRCEQ